MLRIILAATSASFGVLHTGAAGRSALLFGPRCGRSRHFNAAAFLFSEPERRLDLLALVAFPGHVDNGNRGSEDQQRTRLESSQALTSAVSNRTNLPTFKNGTRLSATRRRTWRRVTLSRSASSSMVNSWGNTQWAGSSVSSWSVFLPVRAEAATLFGSTLRRFPVRAIDPLAFHRTRALSGSRAKASTAVPAAPLRLHLLSAPKIVPARS